jgi:hypothetical protein
MKGLIVHYVDRNTVSTSLDNSQNIYSSFFRLRDIVLLQVFKKRKVVLGTTWSSLPHTRHNTVTTFLDDTYL